MLDVRSRLLGRKKMAVRRRLNRRERQLESFPLAGLGPFVASQDLVKSGVGASFLGRASFPWAFYTRFRRALFRCAGGLLVRSLIGPHSVASRAGRALASFLCITRKGTPSSSVKPTEACGRNGVTY